MLQSAAACGVPLWPKLWRVVALLPQRSTRRPMVGGHGFVTGPTSNLSRPSCPEECLPQNRGESHNTRLIKDAFRLPVHANFLRELFVDFGTGFAYSVSSELG